MRFVNVEILFGYDHTIATIPVIDDRGLFCLLNCLDKSENVIAYKVIDGRSVDHKYFEWGPDWNKWVQEFTKEHFGDKP